MTIPGTTKETPRAVEILLVEDSPADIELTREALQDSKLAIRSDDVEKISVSQESLERTLTMFKGLGGQG